MAGFTKVRLSRRPARLGGRRSGHAGFVLLAALALLAGSAPPTTASTEDTAATGGTLGVVLTDERLPVPIVDPEQPVPGGGFAVWAGGGRAFYPVGVTTTGYGALAVVELPSGETIGTVALSPRGYGSDNEVTTHQAFGGHAGHLAVDEASGRVFVPYARPMATWSPVGAAGLAGDPEWSFPTYGQRAARGEFCAVAYFRPTPPTCVAGIHVVDGTSLEVVASIPLTDLTASGLMVGPQLLDLEWSPPRYDGDEGKVHLLVSEAAHTNHNVFATGDTPPYNPRHQTPGVTYLIQLDPVRRRTDWTVRLDACRGGPTDRDSKYTVNYSTVAHLAAIMRSTDQRDPAVYVACHASYTTKQVAIVRVPLDEAGRADEVPLRIASTADADAPPSPAAQAPPQRVTFGPDRAFTMLADPISGRMLIEVVDGAPAAAVWWVFDQRAGQFIGTIGVGRAEVSTTMSALDQRRGRLYTLAATAPPEVDGAGTGGGLFVMDIRRSPLPQALAFPEFAALYPPDAAWDINVFGLGRALQLLPGREPDEPVRIYVPDRLDRDATSWRVLLDQLSPSQEVVLPPGPPRTLDIQEAPGLTSAALDGVARGYGARLLLVGGAEAAARLGPADPVGAAEECNYHGDLVAKLPGPCVLALGYGVSSPCLAPNRDVVFAFVGPDGPAVVDGGGSRGSADPVVVDSASRADAEAPVSRCGGLTPELSDWDEVWSAALFGRAPAGEPAVPWLFPDHAAACVGTEEATGDEVGDAVAQRFEAAVSCEREEASGHSYARSAQAGDVGLGEALSSFRIYRDPGRGIVARVESVARGITLGGVVRIDTVRGSAESWANGRRQPVPADAREPGYQANCDVERSAGTCFTAHVFGFATPAYRCGPCGDEQAMSDAVSRALGANAAVRLRKPDPELAHGAEDGFTAAVQKADAERFGDLVLNNDLLQTILPALEIIRYAPPNRPLSRGGPRGRQVYQFAGVEVSSSYSIGCLLVYDEQGNSCAAEAVAPGAITVNLEGSLGQPLAGGVFELRRDADGDGVAGLADQLVPAGTCLTAADGIGTCRWSALPPGDYVAVQTAAPSGYAVHREPWAVRLASGESRTVTFVNASDEALVRVLVHDEHGRPAAGAIFALFADSDADGRIAAGAAPVGTCTTNASGECVLRLKPGSYVVVQTAASAGLQPVGPIALVLTAAGQVATVGVVNAAADASGGSVAEVDAPTVGYEPAPALRPTETSAAPPAVDQPVATPRHAGPLGGTIERVIRAPRDALGLLARAPVEMAAWATSFALLFSAVLSVRRRALVRRLVPAGGVLPIRAPRAPRTAGSAPGGRAFTTTALDAPVVSGAAPGALDGAPAAVVVAAAHPFVRALAVERLGASVHCEVRAVVDSLEDLEGALLRERPDVLVLDLALPAGDATDICDLLHELHPPERTVGIVPPNRSSRALAGRGVECGIGGLLVAGEDLVNGQLPYAVRCVALGKPCFGPTVQSELLELPRRPQHKIQTVEHRLRLSPRQREIALLAASGLRRKEIAERLFLTPGTVKWQMRAIREKLGVTNPWDIGQLRRRLAELGLWHDSFGDA